MYLENIFNGSADIAKSMQSDTKKFQYVDIFWKDFMRGVNNNPTAHRLATQQKDGVYLVQVFQNHNKTLEDI